MSYGASVYVFFLIVQVIQAVLYFAQLFSDFQIYINCNCLDTKKAGIPSRDAGLGIYIVTSGWFGS